MATTGTLPTAGTIYLTHLHRNAWQLDARRVHHLAEQACDAGEITPETCQHLRKVARVLYTRRPDSKMYRAAALKMQEWAAKYGA